MPFGFGRKKTDEPADANRAAGIEIPRPVGFHGYTEDWQLEGTIELTGRLLDTLNRREAISVTDIRWAPADGSTEMEAAPGIETMDPYDLVVVIAGPDTLAALTDDEQSAHRIHKVSYDVAIQAPPFRVVGSIQLNPGSEPESVMQRGTHMFAAVTDPELSLGDMPIDLGGAKVVLVNRFYVRGVAQVDLKTGEPYPPMPGFMPGAAG